MKPILTASIFLALLLPVTTEATGGEVNNGGGAAEQNFTIAYLSLESFIDRCIGVEACRLSKVETSTLQKIKDAMPEERKNTDQLQFNSGSTTVPNLFDIDGAIRVAKTGSDVGSPVLLNLDLIYPKDLNGAVRAMTIPEAVGILIHEFGHHHSVSSHRDLDLLGAKVQSIAQGQVNQTWLHSGRISLTTVNHYTPRFIGPPYNAFFFDYAMPSIIVGTAERFIDITREISEQIKCPASGSRLDGYNLSNVRWKRGRGAGGFDDIPVLIRVCVIKNCPEDPSASYLKTETIEFDMRFQFERTADGLRNFMTYTPGSLQAKSVNDDWLPCPHDN